MVMSQGTYTFLACFAGFWLIWALVVMLCCFCSFLQRRLKRRHEQRLREQCLRTVEIEPLSCPPAPSVPPPPPPPAPAQLPREPALFCTPPPPPPRRSPPVPLPVPHPMPQATWVSLPDSEIFGKPPCYEEAVLMEDPPPPYSEVLADPRGGTYVKPRSLRQPSTQRERHDAAPAKPPVMTLFPERGYSSLIRLPSSQRWDSLGHLLSNMDLNHNLGPPAGSAGAAAVATMPRREPRAPLTALRGLQGGIAALPGRRQGAHGGIQGGFQSLRVLEPSCSMPTAFPLLGRSTAV